MGLELIGLVVLIAYTTFAALQWCANKQAADATTSAAHSAEGANQLAHDAMVKSNRPWLGIDGYPVVLKPIKIRQEGGVQSAVLFSIKNFGTAPALHVNMDMGMNDFVAYSLVQFKQSADALCRLAELRTKPSVPGEEGTGPYIFPNGTYQQRGDMTNPSVKNLTQSFRLIGCIAYWDQYREHIHHSTFCFRGDSSIKDAGTTTRFSVCPINQNAD